MGRLGRQYAHTVATNFVLKFVVGLVISVITARALGAAGRGEYNLLILVVTTLTTLLNFGIGPTNTTFLARGRLSKASLYRISIIFSVVLSLLSIVFLLLLKAGGVLHFILPAETPTATVAMAIGLVPFVFFNLFAQAIVVGEQRIEFVNNAVSATQSLLAALLVGLYWVGALDVAWAVRAYAVSVGALTVTFVAAEWKVLKEAPRAPLSAADMWTHVRFSAVIHVGNLAQFLNYRLNAFVVNAFLGTSAVGLYVLSVNLGETLWLLSSSMAMVLLPVLVNQPGRSKELSVKAALGSFGVSALIGAAGFIVGPTIIRLLFGLEFEGSIIPFLILLPGIVIFSLTNVLAANLTAAGRPGVNGVIAYVSLGVTLTFDILLIPKMGIAGAAVASMISYSVSSALTLIAFQRLNALTGGEFLQILASSLRDLASARDRWLPGRGKNDSGSPA